MAIIHVAGGGFNQLQLCSRVKQLGFKLALTHPTPTSPCHLYADHFLLEDISNFSVVADWAQALDIVGSISDASDIGLACALYINSRLFNDKSLHPNELLHLFNKANQHQYLKERGLGDFLPGTFSPASTIFKHKARPLFDYPLIAKPPNSQGSKGVSIVESPAQLDSAIISACDSSATGEYLLQEYIRGPEVSVDSLLQDDSVHQLCIGFKKHYPHNSCLDQSIIFTKLPSLPLYRKLQVLNEKVIRALNIPRGLFHAEYIYCTRRRRWFLIEIAARLGGGGISSFVVPFLTGIDPQSFLIQDLLSYTSAVQPFQFKSPSPSVKCVPQAASLHFLPNNLSFSYIKRKAEHQLPYFKGLSVLCSSNMHSVLVDTVRPKDSRSRGEYIILGSSLQDAKSHWQFVKALTSDHVL